mmetsp:Transcript_18963/g.33919  ORF Transcript_18963/g.33919 Transcript_18963/m.33919 type:complete len:90 (+) Transcript_18963:113-382(+)
MSMRSATLSLYRNMLRQANQYKDYNFRLYILRRVRDQFKSRKNVASPEETASLLAKGRETLEVIQRQRTIDNMYSRGANVMEKIQMHPN